MKHHGFIKGYAKVFPFSRKFIGLNIYIKSIKHGIYPLLLCNGGYMVGIWWQAMCGIKFILSYQQSVLSLHIITLRSYFSWLCTVAI